MKRSLSHKLLRVISGSNGTLTTRFRHPDRTFTIWWRLWQVITCVTTALVEPLAFALPGKTYQIAWIAGPHLNSLENFIFPCTSWRQMTLLFSAGRLKQLSFSSLKIYEEETDSTLTWVWSRKSVSRMFVKCIFMGRWRAGSVGFCRVSMDWLCRSHEAVRKRHERVSLGRPHWCVASWKVRQRAIENANCRATRKREATDVLVWEMAHCKTSQEPRGTHKSGATRVNNHPFPKVQV